MTNFEDQPIVLQLQYLAQKNSSDIEELLRMAKLVASKLNLNDLTTWSHNELMGYSDKSEIPSYRRTRGNISVFNPYQGSIPFLISDNEVDSLICEVHMHEPIGNYAKLLEEENTNFLQVNLSREALHYLYSAQEKKYGTAFKPSLNVPKATLTNIFTYVRNSIFNWAIDLEKSGILGEGMQFTSEEKSIAMTNSYKTYHIGNMQGIAGDIKDNSQVTQTNQMINQLDIKSLLSTLKNTGIHESDLKDLEQALSSDSPPEVAGEFGEQTSKWYGKMITKAASGVWDVSVSTAANLLTGLLNSFYGLN